MLTIKKYTDDIKDEWDDFVLNKSINGTFLQTRNFIEYHPENRFVDSSFFVVNEKDVLVAVVLACDVLVEDEKILYSHKGTTFGGLVLSKKCCNAKAVIEILESIEEFALAQSYKKIVLKQTSIPFAQNDTELIDYALYQQGYQTELHMAEYIDYKEYALPTISNVSRGKVRYIKTCKKENMEFVGVNEDKEIAAIHALLVLTLEKYGVLPVHTLQELLDLKNGRLKDIIEFYGVYHKDALVAGSVMFKFLNTNVVHAQYFAADPEYYKLSPMTFLYYSLIEEYRVRGFRSLSWGTSTEGDGKIVNWGLTQSKESFGGKHYTNKIYSKNI